MQHTVRYRWSLIALGVLLAALGWPTAAVAQTVSGQARAVLTTVAGLFGPMTTALADTGTLADPGDAREASMVTGNVPSLLTGGVLHAATIGWSDEVHSEASLAALTLTVGGVTIGADFVMARAQAILGTTGAGGVNIEGLSIDGLPITVTDDPNQVILIPGGRLVVNEQQTSLTGAIVNALHVMVDGIADVVVASASAGIQ